MLHFLYNLLFAHAPVAAPAEPVVDDAESDLVPAEPVADAAAPAAAIPAVPLMTLAQAEALAVAAETAATQTQDQVEVQTQAYVQVRAQYREAQQLSWEAARELGRAHAISAFWLEQAKKAAHAARYAAEQARAQAESVAAEILRTQQTVQSQQTELSAFLPIDLIDTVVAYVQDEEHKLEVAGIKLKLGK